MSALSIISINRKIEETEAYIESIGSVEDTQFLKFEKEELLHRLDVLKNEKASLEKESGSEKISMRFYGDDISAGRISNRILALMLQGFQNTIDEIANAVAGSGAQRGQISEAIKKSVDFDVVATFPGSFGIRLEKKYEQENLVPEAYAAGNILDKFFSIMENSCNSEELVDIISTYGNRAVSKYKIWLNDMKTNNVNIEFDWIGESSEKRSIDLSITDIDSAIHVLDEIGTIKENTVEITGTLTGLNIRNGSFEILSSDDNKVIHGNGDIETLKSICHLLGSEAVVELKSFITESSVYGEKIKYTILGAKEQEK